MQAPGWALIWYLPLKQNKENSFGGNTKFVVVQIVALGRTCKGRSLTQIDFDVEGKEAWERWCYLESILKGVFWWIFLIIAFPKLDLVVGITLVWSQWIKCVYECVRIAEAWIVWLGVLLTSTFLELNQLMILLYRIYYIHVLWLEKWILLDLKICGKIWLLRGEWSVFVLDVKLVGWSLKLLSRSTTWMLVWKNEGSWDHNSKPWYRTWQTLRWIVLETSDWFWVIHTIF